MSWISDFALYAFGLGMILSFLWWTTVIVRECMALGASLGGWCVGLAIIATSASIQTLLWLGVYGLIYGMPLLT